MFRLILTYLSQAGWARKIVQNWGFAKKTASRFVAGETLDQALEVVKILNGKGISTTLDHLGENINSADEANQAAREILNIIDRLDHENVSSGVSIKLSQIGLVIDQALCEKNLSAIFALAKGKNIFVRVDMEDSHLTQTTLDIYQSVVSQGYEDYSGIAIQAYLRRSEEDVKRLISDGLRIRLCKGAYKEPRTIAFPKKDKVDLNFDKLTDLLFDRSLELDSRISADGRIPPLAALATHDQTRIDHALASAKQLGLDPKNLEFQMLYGIREDLQNELVKIWLPGQSICSLRRGMVPIFWAPFGRKTSEPVVFSVKFIQEQLISEQYLWGSYAI